jgi:hypothetical protein
MDNVPDVHDEADFEIPDTQAVLEKFMSNYDSNMSKLAEDEYQSQSVLLDSLQMRVNDNLGHPMEQYPSNWLRYGVALIVCQYHS